MGKLLSFFPKKRAGSRHRFWPARRPRRVIAGAVVALSLALGASVLTAGQAMAVTVSGHSLPNTAGHTCKNVGTFNWPGGQGQEVFCIELAEYDSATGITSIVAQVEAICEYPNGATGSCGTVDGTAMPYFQGETGGDADATSFHCDSSPSAPCTGSSTTPVRTYFAPIPNLDNTSYFIGPGRCINNIWAVLVKGSNMNPVPPGTGIPPTGLTIDLGTPHFNACWNGSGVSFTR